MKVYDVNPMGGGRIIRDKLWFYLTYRADRRPSSTVPGMWFNRNAGNPNAWTVDFDRSRPAFNDNLERNGIARITWQATPRNKINVHWSEQYNDQLDNEGGGTATHDAGSERPERSTSPRTSSRPPGRRRSRAGCCSRPAGARTRRGTAIPHAADRRHAQRPDDPARRNRAARSRT